MKAGLADEDTGEEASSLACYNKIEDMYPQSVEAYDISASIARVSE